MTPQISDQSGTVNACKTLLWWFIVMTQVLLCYNVYRYERHFGSFYHNPTISEKVSIAKWARQMGQHREYFFLLKYNNRE